MNVPALAPTPALPTSTGTGASTGPPSPAATGSGNVIELHRKGDAA